MRTVRLFIVGTALTFVLWSGCTQSDPTGPVASLGSHAVTKYVAIGNSLTAGYQSNALYASAQQYSYPNLIAQQLLRAGATIQLFEQPLYGDPGNADPATGKASRLEILSLSSPIPSIGPRGLDPGSPTNTALGRPYDNLGIPGIPLASFLDTTNFTGNPFVDLVLRPSMFPKSVFQQVQVLQPDLITLWLGNNDVLGYATSGGTSPSAPTPTGTFAALYAQVLDTLRAILPNAKILVGNIPDVTTIPFFTTVGPAAQAQGINAVYGIHSSGDTAVMSLSTNLLTLNAQAELSQGKGILPSNPLPSSVVLDSDEIAIAQAAVSSFNAAIASVAAARGVALFDANALLKKANTEGYSIAGERFTSQYVAGGLFSLDGVYPSSRGYAIVANEMIAVLNQHYGMSIPLVDISTVPGIPAPAAKLGKGQIPQISRGALENIHKLFSTGVR
ncbi:MAG: SGNH/GDSL hydrolase family protein [Ignavibacteriales bacterium]|nr:SGNH/GDSL hydrolase family protein [Ignavibacteriales bacterium]